MLDVLVELDIVVSVKIDVLYATTTVTVGIDFANDIEVVLKQWQSGRRLL